MKKFDFETLEAFVGRIDSEEKYMKAQELLAAQTHLTPSEQAELDALMGDKFLDYVYEEEGNPFLPDYMTSDRDERDYGPSNPWDAPGMKVSDFITGVSWY